MTYLHPLHLDGSFSCVVLRQADGPAGTSFSSIAPNSVLPFRQVSYPLWYAARWAGTKALAFFTNGFALK